MNLAMTRFWWKRGHCGFLIGIFRVVEQNILVESRNVSLGEHNIIRNLEIDAFFDKPIA